MFRIAKMFYNKRFLNILSVCLFVYIICTTKGINPNMLNELFYQPPLPMQPPASYTLTLDPQKSPSERSWIETFVIWYYRDQIANELKKIDPATKNKYGDKIIYHIEQIRVSDNRATSSELEYIIGITQGPYYLQEHLYNADIGQNFDFETDQYGEKMKIKIFVKDIIKSNLPQ